MLKKIIKLISASLIVSFWITSGAIDASNKNNDSMVHYSQNLETKFKNVGPKRLVTKKNIKAKFNNKVFTIKKNKVIYIKSKIDDSHYLVAQSNSKKAKLLKVNNQNSNYYDNSTNHLSKTSHDNLISYSKNWSKNLSKNERKAIYDYTLDSYYSMNSYLRYPTSHYTSKTKNQVSLVKNSINTYYLNSPMTVYRGISGSVLQSSLMNKYNGTQQNNYNIDKLDLGSTYLDNGFSSTSLNKMIATQFTNKFMLKINLPTGNLGAYISSLSASKTENEFLLNPATKFIVTNVQKATSTLTERYTLQQNGRTKVKENKQNKTYTYITLNLKA